MILWKSPHNYQLAERWPSYGAGQSCHYSLLFADGRLAAAFDAQTIIIQPDYQHAEVGAPGAPGVPVSPYRVGRRRLTHFPHLCTAGLKTKALSRSSAKGTFATCVRLTSLNVCGNWTTPVSPDALQRVHGWPDHADEELTVHGS